MRVNKVRAVLPLFFLLIVAGCKTMPASDHARYSGFLALTNFSNFTATKNSNGETVLLSPEIKAPIPWNQLVLSWNVKPVPGTFLRIEARAIQQGHTTKFFSWGQWSPDDKTFSRYSITNQKDADGDVRADTLALNQLAGKVQIRLTLGGTKSAVPALKFIGISFCNTKIKSAPLPPNRTAWGK